VITDHKIGGSIAVTAASTNTKADKLAPAEARELLRRMHLIRAFDSRLPSLYTQGLIRGSSHAAIGQEAVAVGACAALARDDYITSTHRGHGHAIAKGASVDRMMAELLGREQGFCRGKGGSMHIADFSVGMLGANGIVGGGFGIAGGAALSIAMRGEDRVALCFFGEGALSQGAFHEVANIASLWKLPLVLVCENNQFAMSARPAGTIAVGDRGLAGRADAYGFPGCTIDGMDVLAVRDAVGAARARARVGAGPSLIVAECYRFEGHFSGDTLRYREQTEADDWRKRDPIRAFELSQLSTGSLQEEDVEGAARDAEAAVTRALEFAIASPAPQTASAWEDVGA
jgi:acetoin:2,6-dichlorophenolindophenol oxidoreductase subunit alpha